MDLEGGEPSIGRKAAAPPSDGPGEDQKSARKVQRTLPEELFPDILSRLPARSICRFRSVCKLFNSLVSDPSFVSLYSTRSGGGAIMSFVQHFTDSAASEEELEINPAITLHCFHFEEMDPLVDLQIAANVLKIPFPAGTKTEPTLAASCDGMLCFRGTEGGAEEMYFVFNPLTRGWIEVPPPGDPDASGFVIGFYFAGNEYRLLRLRHITGDENGGQLNEFAVHSLGRTTEAWRRIGGCPFFRYSSSDYWGEESRCVEANGKLYWVDVSVAGSSVDPAITVFDSETEVFSQLAAPRPNTRFQGYRLLRMGDGRLGLNESVSETELVFWVLREDGDWTKLFAIDSASTEQLPEDWIKVGDLRPLLVGRGRDVLFSWDYGETSLRDAMGMYAFDSKEGRLRHVFEEMEMEDGQSSGVPLTGSLSLAVIAAAGEQRPKSS